MGFFSWTCAKTQLPIMAAPAWGEDPHVGPILCNAVLVSAKGVVASGLYDGHGCLGGLDLMQAGYDLMIDEGEAALVLRHWYRDETLGDLKGRSLHEPGQGFFHCREDLLERIRSVGLPDDAPALSLPEKTPQTGPHRLLHVFHNDHHAADFTMRVVGKGDRYGKDMVLVHENDVPLVEFYDRRWLFDKDPDGNDLGQFVSRYNLTSLMERGRDGRNAFERHGLALDGGTGWAIGPKGLEECFRTLQAAGFATQPDPLEDLWEAPSAPDDRPTP